MTHQWNNLRKLFEFYIFVILLDSTLSTTPISGYDYYPNINCPNNDISTSGKNTAEDCKTLCEATTTCIAFVFQVFSANPPQFCYTKHTCEVSALISNNNLFTYIRNTSTTDITTTAATSTLSLSFQEYSADDNVKEGPHAIPIGSSMLILLLVFIIFFALLDINNYRKSLKRGLRNCRDYFEACKSSKTNGRNAVEIGPKKSVEFSKGSVLSLGSCCSVAPAAPATPTDIAKDTFTMTIRSERSFSISSSKSVDSTEGNTANDKKSLLKSTQMNNFYKNQSYA